MTKNFGFHLIELLITLSIVAVLAAICVPQYSHYIVHARRLEAASMLAKLAVAMEKYQFENNTYQGATLGALKIPEFIVKNNYQLILQSVNTDDYLIAAKPLRAQAEKDTVCATLTLDSNGEKNITGTGNVNDCW